MPPRDALSPGQPDGSVLELVEHGHCERDADQTGNEVEPTTGEEPLEGPGAQGEVPEDEAAGLRLAVDAARDVLLGEEIRDVDPLWHEDDSEERQ